MKKISLFTFINIIFAVSALLFFILLFIYIKVDKKHYFSTQNKRYTLLLNNIKNMNEEQLKKLFSNQLNIKEVHSNKKRSEILQSAHKLIHKKNLQTTMDILNYNNKTYIYIKNYNLNVIFLDDPSLQYDFSKILIAALVILFILGLLYILLLQKLKPLRTLNNNITQFKKGDFSIYQNINSQDEIGTISQNFNQAIENIRYLIESKHLFMRNIMHELKTPITKALFLANMIDTSNKKEKEELIENLYTMNSILKQLANIDKFQSQFSNLLLEKINISALLAKIKKELKSDNIFIKKEGTLELIANKELLTRALKNLIENGLKYSNEQSVTVVISKKSLSILSKGSRLNKELPYYTQPFTQENKNQKGYGLGLYIVSEILKLHNFTLEYQYKDGLNIFTVNLDKFTKSKSGKKTKNKL